jgi:hypothetical protein
MGLILCIVATVLGFRLWPVFSTFYAVGVSLSFLGCQEVHGN